MSAAVQPKAFSVVPRLLYGPGPAMIDPRAQDAMQQPALGIRDPQFLTIADEIRSGLRSVFGTSNRMTFPLPAGGSGGMEACVANFVVPGSKFAVFASGHFADRISEMARRYRAKVVRLEKPWGQIFSENEAAEFLRREKPDVVSYVQAETSTGAYQSGRAIVPAAREIGALVIADCVTSLGAMPVELDEVGVDIGFSCSQKGLSCPAGLSPVSISQRAWEVLHSRPEPIGSWYFDLRLVAGYFEPPHTYHHTPSPPLYYSLHQGLAVIEEEGIQNRWQRHRRAGDRLMPALTDLGFTPLVEDADARLWHLAVVKPPAGVDEARIRQHLLENDGIEIAGGLGQLAGKVLRIGVMGPLATDETVDRLIIAMRAAA